MTPHDIAGKPYEVVSNDIITLNNSYFPHILDYHSTFPIVKGVEGPSVEQLINDARVYLLNKGYHTA